MTLDISQMDSGRTEGYDRSFEADGLRPRRNRTDLHKKVAVHWRMPSRPVKRFDMRVNSRDGDQDLSMWMRDVEEVVREIMRDERFKGHQNFQIKLHRAAQVGSSALSCPTQVSINQDIPFAKQDNLG